jgi:hypothetical protein
MPNQVGARFTGLWHVFTETGSHYEINFDRMTVRRDAGAGGLRRDGEDVPLRAVDELTVGMPAEMWIEVRTDGVLTFRRTSVVTALVPADETCLLGPMESDVAIALADPAPAMPADHLLDLPWTDSSQDPSRCYSLGCDVENALLLHLGTEPDVFADLCLPHAHANALANQTTRTCDCPFCCRARELFDLPAG